MTLETYYKYYSQKRFRRYLGAVNFDVAKAVRLYNLQEKLSGEIHALLARFEVVVRNQIDQNMREKYHENWLVKLSENTSVLNSRNTYSSFAMLKDAVETLRQKGDIDHDDIVATIYFGYWTSLFQPHQLKRLENTPLHTFTLAPKRDDISHVIHMKINLCRKTRNLVAHLEPLIFKENSSELNFKRVDMTVKNVLDLSMWMNVDTQIYRQYINSIQLLKQEISELVNI